MSPEAKLLTIGLIALAPICTIVWLEEYVLLDRIMQDSNPAKFALIVVAWLGTGATGAGITGYILTLLGKRLPSGKISPPIKISLLLIAFLTTLLLALVWWGRGMH
jgi:hypothetical protein